MHPSHSTRDPSLPRPSPRPMIADGGAGDPAALNNPWPPLWQKPPEPAQPPVEPPRAAPAQRTSGALSGVSVVHGLLLLAAVIRVLVHIANH